MLSILNLLSLILSSVCFSLYYILSVQPAQMEKTKGAEAYKLAARYRMICSIYMGVAFVNFVLYRWIPLPFDPFPLRFPWSYWLSITTALVLGIPATSLMIVAIRDAGKETLSPEKEHTLYTGIYKSIRHPQALGELSIWYVVALLLNSPFLLFISALYTPVWIMWCFLEEKDLVIRYGKRYEEYRSRTGMFIPKARERKPR